MSNAFQELSNYVKEIGKDHFIFDSTPKEKEDFEGILFIRGIPILSLLNELASE